MAQLSYIATSKLIDLLRTAGADADHAVWVRSPDQLGVGRDPLSLKCIIDLSREQIRLVEVDAVAVDEKNATQLRVGEPVPLAKASRQTGKYLVDIRGTTIECKSLKHLLSEALRALERHKPGTLEKLSSIKPRTKRIVAREPGQLFDQPELSSKYAEKLMDGWWFGTNNSAAETNAWLERGCKIAGLDWGKEFTTSL